ncbi:MAG: nucleotidyltransferase family protein [Myxococcota bacterium]
MVTQDHDAATRLPARRPWLPELDDSTWRCAQLLGRPVLHGDEVQELRAMVQGLDAPRWQALARRAVSRRTAPWVLGHIRSLGLAVDPLARQLLDQGEREAVQRTLECDQMLFRLAPTLLEGADPACMVLKGRAIEGRAYPAGVMRPMVDVDLLVRPGQRIRVRQALEVLGLRRTWRSRSGHIAMWSAERGAGAVEVHERPLCPFRFAPMAADTAMAGLNARAVRGPNGWLEPDPIDHTAFLLIHLLEYIYADMRHLADLALWLRAVRPDPERVVDRLREWQGLAAGAAAARSVATWDPEAVDPALLRMATAQAPGRGPQRWVAAGLRTYAGARVRWTARPHGQWLEAAGLMAHLDRPWRWLASWTPLGPGMTIPKESED